MTYAAHPAGYLGAGKRRGNYAAHPAGYLGAGKRRGNFLLRMDLAGAGD